MEPQERGLVLIKMGNMQLHSRFSAENKEHSKQAQLRTLSPPIKEQQYSALQDKYAFGYFQNQSVQRHLKKLLKVHSSQSSCQNIKNLPPSGENRKIIGTLSEKVMKPHSQAKNHSEAIKTQRLTAVEKGKNFSVSVVKTHTKSEKNLDIFYPYKQNLKLKSLQKLKRNVERREKMLRRAEENSIVLPRLRTLADQKQAMEIHHEKKMQKLIEREDRLLASKVIALNRLKTRELTSSLSNNPHLRQKQRHPKLDSFQPAK